ncbi:DMT family transporter [Flavobacterium urocaniciphilum]|uniref:Permease of the drug/metabolite transporter (DMT) superfamily n=1 Tax=Flavobacterium urocaniciphilum TaxID=1299341 RepID=A0A1H9D966_9FLAO|nr:DMT family transporter [Flavobacterium urocaniciphilum]SEQ09891.1 Permease of the drug/metabolite transporter (DMT) superfamily [Flavobacterium urocaniciphilum]
MNSRAWALVCAWIVAIIYGVTFTIAKDVMPKYIDAFGFIVLRVGGATLLFWLFSFLGPKEKIAKKDFLRIAVCAFFGVAFNMLTFFKGLSYTSPIMGAVLMVTTPMIVLILSSILMKEKMKSKKVLGILLGLAGTVTLILYGKALSNASNATLGNLLVFVNAVSYGFYLIFVKKLMDRYNAFTFVKYIYLFGFFMVLPFGFNELKVVNWNEIPLEIGLKIGFVVVFSTFLTYLLNLVSMRNLKPTTVAVFIYLQPFFATVFAIYLEKDNLNMVKIVSALLIFVGVYLVIMKESNKKNQVKSINSSEN